MLSTIALFASSRRDGNTGRFIDRIASPLGIEVVDLGDRRLTAYDYPHRNRHVLQHEQIIFATPIYWYSVSPAMKIFLDRISDFLELPELVDDGRRLRGKSAHVVCTSVSDAPSTAFVAAFRHTFDYLGMRFGGVAHANCRDGFVAGVHDQEVMRMASLIREAV
jgi:NAD(P)H-dependent FMN reductase